MSGVGLSTYALFWEWSDAAQTPIRPDQMLARTKDLGCDVFQFCDYPPLEAMNPAQLGELADQARELGIAIEVGTRGTASDHLNRYLDLAAALDAHVLRSMVQVGERMPSLAEAAASVRSLLPRLEELGVDLGFETYEQLPSATLVDFVRDIGHDRVGICLDPANCVAGLELPNDVINRCAERTVNLHVKDFAFSRRQGWVGFTYAGAPMGEGLLDYPYELDKVRPAERGISQIVEHWLVWQGDIDTTIAAERRWTSQTLDVIRNHTKEN